MTRRELQRIHSLIEWAVDPQPPLPAVADTDAVDAMARNIERSPAPQRAGLRAAVAVAGALPRRALESGPLAPLGELVTALAHLAYYGDLGVMHVVSYDPAAVVERGRAVRTAEGRW